MTNLLPEWVDIRGEFMAEFTRPFLKVQTPTVPGVSWGFPLESLSYDKRAALGTSESSASSNMPSFTEMSQSAVLRRPVGVTVDYIESYGADPPPTRLLWEWVQGIECVRL